MLRSMSPRSRALMGLSSMPSDCATVWIAANWATPGPRVGFADHCDACHTWRSLLQELHPFAAQAVLELREPGRVASRVRQTVDKTGPDRIDDLNEHDWNR